MGEIIARRDEMEKMGWQMQIDMPELTAGKPQSIEVTVLDGAGQAFDVDSAILYYYRPSNKEYDGQLTLTPAEGTGQYEGQLTLPLKGKYDFVMEVVKEEKTFNLGRTIFVKEASESAAE
jgi:nitrogen fixation protein FixH